MKALVLFGVAPEDEWPYYIWTFDNEPDAYLYSYAANYKSIQYLRLDSDDLPTYDDVLNNIRAALSKNFAAMFGFPVYSSFGNGPDIPYPSENDTLLGGHAVLAVGYDDNKQIGSAPPGALKFRNSWGVGWGDGGYGWMPYQYLLKGLATDFWTCFNQAWVDTGVFD